VTVGEEGAPQRPTLARHWAYWPSLVVLIVALAVTAVLVVVAHRVDSNNEKRLLRLRVREAASALTTAVGNLQTPLSSVAALADGTGGDASKFRRFITPYVGSKPPATFISVSLWRIDSLLSGPKSVVGVTPELADSSAVPFLVHAAHSPKLSIMGLLDAPSPRLGYAFGAPGSGRYVAYGEAALPKNRQSRLRSNQAFSDLNFVIYLGRRENPRNLLTATTTKLPLTGEKQVVRIPFGDSTLTLALSPRKHLGGALPQVLPRIILAAGILLSIVGAAVAASLARGRRHAEGLAVDLERAAEEKEELYAQQRNIAETLQHALLPEGLPELEGVEASARHVAGEAGMEIGGDWYDVIPIPRRGVLVVVGDVSGHGLRAASTMARLRYGIHAYAAQEDPPDVILSKLSGLLSLDETGQLATVLCVMVDLSAHEVTVSSAGHLPPLLVTAEGGQYLDGEVGVPIGVEKQASYPANTRPIPAKATLLAFTDGLVERRHESLDQGLARLQAVATASRSGLQDLLTRVLSELHDHPPEDDTAIVGLRWTR
jgi:serine phosphatase RsbU (regulator of sigma subunit)